MVYKSVEIYDVSLLLVTSEISTIEISKRYHLDR